MLMFPGKKKQTQKLAKNVQNPTVGTLHSAQHNPKIFHTNLVK